ncbi:hypothetical protein QQ045_007674 [Rhodiola kirilowii]
MDGLPDQIIFDIFTRLQSNSEKNALSLSCKRFLKLRNEETTFLKIGCGLKPVNQALTSLCHRFQNLEALEISYSGWMSNLGKQMDDEGLLILSSNCPSLQKLTLSYCTFITDAGLTNLASCSKLSDFKLNFAPRITSCGIQTIVISCKRLSSLHLNRCVYVANDEWLEYLGKLDQLEDLSIRNCRCIRESDLIRLGTCLSKLKRMQFEVDANNRCTTFHGSSIFSDLLLKKDISCDNLLELSLVNCRMSPGIEQSYALPVCPKLEKIHLDMCMGVKDSDIVSMAHSSKNLLSLSLRVPKTFDMFSVIPFGNHLRLTDAALLAVAQNCSRLESVRISCVEGAEGELPLPMLFSTNGILALMRNCPIRELSLDYFNDSGMEGLCSSAEYLESLELFRCQDISDDGIQFLAKFPRLRAVRLTNCMGITDEGMKPLVESHKLALLVVEDCPLVSEEGIQGAAKTVTFRQDLSWLY